MFEIIEAFKSTKFTFIAQDAEDDDAPIQPNVFVENVWIGIGRGSAKEGEVEEETLEEDDPNNKHVIVSHTHRHPSTSMHKHTHTFCTLITFKSSNPTH